MNVLGWPKSPSSFFRKIKGTFFMFTNNFIDLGILSMSAISYVVYNIDDFQLMSQFDHCPLQLVYLTAEHRPGRHL